MKKRLVSMILAISMVLSLVPAPAFAQGVQFAAPAPDTAASPQELEEENADGVITIKSSSDGYTGDGEGVSWTYDKTKNTLTLISGSFELPRFFSSKLVIQANATVLDIETSSNGYVDATVSNYGTIAGGTFNHTVRCYDSARITGGRFASVYFYRDGGIVEGGYFNGSLTLDNSSTVTTIAGGTFVGTISIANNAALTITGGIFKKGITAYRDKCTLDIKGGYFETAPSTWEGGDLATTLELTKIQSGIKVSVPLNAASTSFTGNYEELYVAPGVEVTLQSTELIGTVSSSAWNEALEPIASSVTFTAPAATVTVDRLAWQNPNGDLVLVNGYPQGSQSADGTYTTAVQGKGWRYYDHPTYGWVLEYTTTLGGIIQLPTNTFECPVFFNTYSDFSSGTFNNTVYAFSTLWSCVFNGTVKVVNTGSFGYSYFSGCTFTGDVIVPSDVNYVTFDGCKFKDTGSNSLTLDTESRFWGSDVAVPVHFNSGEANLGYYNGSSRDKAVVLSKPVTVGADASFLVTFAIFADGVADELLNSGNVRYCNNSIKYTVSADFALSRFSGVNLYASDMNNSEGISSFTVYTRSGSTGYIYIDAADTSVVIDTINGKTIDGKNAYHPKNGYTGAVQNYSVTLTSNNTWFDSNNHMELRQALMPLEIQGSNGANPGYPKGYAGADMKGSGWEFKAGSGELIITGEVDLTSQPEVKVPIVTVQENATLTGGEYNKIIQKFTNNGTLNGKGAYRCDVLNNGTVTGSGTFLRNLTNTGTLDDGDVFYLECVTNKGIIKSGTFYATVTNSSTIKNGSFRHSVVNEEDGTIEGGNFSGQYSATGDVIVTNKGIIKDGTFSCVVKNSNTIQGGTFSASVTNNENAVIEGGTFTGDVTNSEGASIENGTFTITGPSDPSATDSNFVNLGTIEGGTFKSDRELSLLGTVTGTAVFNSSVIVLGSVEGGTFNGSVTNANNSAYQGKISGGTFNAAVDNASTISGGTFTEKVSTSGTITDGRFEKEVTESSTSSITGGIFKVPTMADVVYSRTLTGNVSYSDVQDLYACVKNDKKFAGAKILFSTADGQAPHASGDYSYSILVTDKEGDTTELTDPDWQFHLNSTPLTFDGDGVPEYGKAPYNNATGLYEGDGWTYDEANHKLTLTASMDLGMTDPAGPFCSVETVIEDGVTVTNGRFTGNVQNDGIIESGSFYGSTVTNNGTIQNGTFRNDTLNNNGIIENGGFLCTVNNRGILEGGSYHDTVVNADNGVIRYGEFVEGSTVNNYGTIEDGAFIGVVLNLVSADEDGSVAHKGEIKGGSFPGTIENQSILSSGRFNGNVVNQPAGTITGGDFKECTSLINRGTLNAPDSTFGSTVSNHGTIEDGTFAGLVLNYTEGSASGVIHGGTFQTDVNNHTSITGGSFAGHVTNLAGATISGGSFGSDVDNAGTIEDGTFTAPVDNSGAISGGTFEEIVTDEEGSVIHKGAVFKKPGPDDVQLSTSDLPTEGVYSDLTSVNAAVTNPNKFADAAIQYVLNGTVVDKPQKPGDYTCNVVVTDNAGGTHVLEELTWTFHLNGAPLTFDSYGKPICTDAEQNEETGEWIGDGWTYVDFGDGTGLLTISRSMDLGEGSCSVETLITGTDVTVTGGKFSGCLTVDETCTLKDAVSTDKVINLGTLTGCTLKDLINYLQGSVKDCEVSGMVENSGTLDSGVFTSTSTVRNDHIISGGTFHGTVNNNYKATVKNGEFTGIVNNGSTIEDGIFSGTVNNLTDGVIRNGTFTGEVKNITTGPDSLGALPGSGIIENGEFTGKVTNNADAVIKSGTFKDVENAGIIENGEFSGTVNNTGTIKDGTFHGTVTSSGTIEDGTFAAESTVANSGTIENGAFDGKVINTADGVIKSGSFTSEVENNGKISGGVYEKPVANEGLIEAGDFYDYVTGNGTITGGNFIPTLADFVDVTYPLDPVPASELAAQMHASLRNANKFQRVEGFLYKRESAVQTFAIRDDLAEDGNTGYSADVPNLPGVYSFRVQVTDNAGVLYTLKNDAWKVTIKGEPLVIVDGKPVTDHVPTDENGTYFGDGWTYDGETLTLTKDITFAEDTRIDTKVDIAAGTTVTGGRYTGEVANSGTLQDAALSGTVKNDGTITGSTLTGEVTNNDQISDSTFTGAHLTNEGSITGGSISGGTLVDNGTLTNVAGVTTLKVTPLCDVYVGEDLLAGHSVLTGTEITLKLSDTVEDSGFSHWIIDGPEGELTWDELNYDDQKAYAEAITQRDFTFTVQEGWSTLTILVQEPGSDTSVSFDAILGTTLFVGTTTVIVYELTTTRYLQSILPEGAAIPRTRSQLAVLLWQAAGKPEPTVQTPYSDIPETETETNKAARWAVETGLLDEKRNATFAPNRYVSKLQVIQAWNKLQEKSSK